MSGEGFASADSESPSRSRSPRAMAVIEAIVAERAGVLAHAREFSKGLERWQLRGRFSAAEAKDISRAVLNFANDIAIGLHVDGVEADAVRRIMRDKIKEMDDDRG